MKHDPILRTAPKDNDSLASDFGLLAEAIVDAFRGMSATDRLESRWSKLRYCGCSF